ncbi:hypothetical protein GCM10011410_33290 [Hoyosella rhizosphaerae]|uniref:Uncharacterized protein n=1 Tax=Hoyosella rhizosphaerae TaxID=1755582 RepID=A0A916ULM8_9ACTN|nr:hypothetical protein GCM10011410_33290 [Hoyosella rhizosphaerae]
MKKEAAPLNFHRHLPVRMARAAESAHTENHGQAPASVTTSNTSTEVFRSGLKRYGLSDETIELLAVALDTMRDDRAKPQLVAMRLRSMLSQLMTDDCTDIPEHTAPRSDALSRVVIQIFEERTCGTTRVKQSPEVKPDNVVSWRTAASM